MAQSGKDAILAQMSDAVAAKPPEREATGSRVTRTVAPQSPMVSTRGFDRWDVPFFLCTPPQKLRSLPPVFAYPIHRFASLGVGISVLRTARCMWRCGGAR